VFKIGIGNDLRDILEVAWFWIEGSKVKVRVRVQQYGVDSNSMSAF